MICPIVLIEEAIRSICTTRMCGISSPRMLDSTTDEAATHIITTIIIAEMIQGITSVTDMMTGELSTTEVEETNPGGTTIETEEVTTMVENDRNAIQII